MRIGTVHKLDTFQHRQLFRPFRIIWFSFVVSSHIQIEYEITFMSLKYGWTAAVPLSDSVPAAIWHWSSRKRWWSSTSMVPFRTNSVRAMWTRWDRRALRLSDRNTMSRSLSLGWESLLPIWPTKWQIFVFSFGERPCRSTAVDRWGLQTASL